ncbi:MAG: alpha/beta hydrolase [Peptostreptococcaceae bacterium]
MGIKKIIKKAFIASLSLLLMTGCQSTPQAEFDEQKLKDLSQEYVEEMLKGDFSSIVSNFSDNIKGKIDEPALKTSWDQVVKDIGKYQGINETTYSQDKNIATVNTILKYEKNGLKISISYNPENQVDGLWLNYAPVKEELISNDKYEEVEIKIGDDKDKLDGILTLPKNTTKSPVVIMVQGSGQSDMDETINQNKPFKDIANGLAENGIASIRYNKRFYQYPQSAGKDMTIQDEVINDVNLAIELAAKNEKLDSEKIYVLGHSLGGMLAPEIANKNDKVAGIISLAGTPRKLEDVILDQNKEAVEAMTDKSDAEKKDLLKQVESEINKVKNLKDSDKGQEVLGINSEYWISLNNINTPEILKNLTIPMLYLQGEKDFQVYADVDYKMWQELCEGKENAEFKLYPDLNHLFMKSNGKRDITEYDTKGNVDNSVIEDISNWVNKK